MRNLSAGLSTGPTNSGSRWHYLKCNFMLFFVISVELVIFLWSHENEENDFVFLGKTTEYSFAENRISIGIHTNISKFWEFKESRYWFWTHEVKHDIQIWHKLFYYFMPLQMRKLWNQSRSLGCHVSRVPITLVDIPYLVSYTLSSQ